MSLSEASDLLGVHASTLRRWADSGRVPCQRTPGGHRRFNRQQLLPLLEGAGFVQAQETEPQRASDQSWHGAFVDADLVEELRELSQRFSGVVVQFLMRSDADDRLLADARALGLRYSDASRRAGIGLTESVELLQYYRGTLVDVAAQAAASDPQAGQRQYARFDAIAGEVLLGLVSGLDPASS